VDEIVTMFASRVGHSASRRGDLARRAAIVLAHLEDRVGTDAAGPAVLHENVTLEIARARELDEPYRHPSDADTEILDTCDTVCRLL
jgi:DNA-binding IclR family transcriptional regulator